MARHFSYRRDGASAFTPDVIAKVQRHAGKARARNASGAGIEDLIERTHAVYAARGQAHLTKQEVPTIGPPTARRVVGYAIVDYLGFEQGGRGLALDVKGVTGRTALEVPTILPIAHKHHKQSVRDHERIREQAKYLLTVRRLNVSVAFLCVDKTRERAWIMTDVERVARGEDVPLRTRDTDLWPAVPFASVEAIARGEPLIDYLSVWAR